MKNKKAVSYVELLANYTLLGLKKKGKNKYEVFVEYAEPHLKSWVDHICDLPGETFEINDRAIAVFKEVEGKNVLKDVYDISFHKFVVKDKVRAKYNEFFKENVKVKRKVG